MDKYHVALSFAGEDRPYVDKVAKVLSAAGVRVIYDDFENTDLWGKDLYAHLTEIYQKRALYTVMFVSRYYKEKLWTNKERQAAQARAFVDSQEYILPAYFDASIEVPGVLKTTGYVNLKNLAPEKLAEKIIQKLRANKVFLIEEKFAYAEDAKADADFPLSGGAIVVKIIKDLKSQNWYTQNPALAKLDSLDWKTVTRDQAFVLGRNIYQAACGNANAAMEILNDLRGRLANIPVDMAEHLLNGMFYETYFDCSSSFRGAKLKARFVSKLFAIQTVPKYQDCIAFIGQALGPYREQLVAIPSSTPQTVELTLRVSKKAPYVVKSVEYGGREMLVQSKTNTDPAWGHLWKLSFKQFTLNEFKELVAEAWGIPVQQLKIAASPKLPTSSLIFPDGMTIAHPAT